MRTARDNTTPVDLHDRRLQQLMRESLDNVSELALMMSRGANLEGCEIVGVFPPEQVETMVVTAGSTLEEDDNVIPYPRRPPRPYSGQT